MSTDTFSTELPNNTYRLAVLCFFTRGYTNKTNEIPDRNGHKTVAFKETYGLASVRMKMPDGTVEYWQQTDMKINDRTGFRANAFERRNADGSVYLEGGRKPQAMMIFPGNTGDRQDRETIKRVLTGGGLEHIYKNVDEFTNDYMRRLDERASLGSHERPFIVIGTHSIGSNALASGMHLREKGFNVRQTILYEPVGAGQAVQQLTPHEAHRLFGNNPTEAQLGIVAQALTYNVSSIRNDDGTMFHEKGGNDTYDNVMIGETYRYRSDTISPGYGYINDHMLEPLGISLQRYQGEALIPTHWADLSVREIAGGGRPLTEAEKDWAAVKGAAFDKVLKLTALFAEAAAMERHQNPKDRQPDFYDLKLPGVTDDWGPALSGMPQIKIVVSQPR